METLGEIISQKGFARSIRRKLGRRRIYYDSEEYYAYKIQSVGAPTPDPRNRRLHIQYFDEEGKMTENRTTLLEEHRSDLHIDTVDIQRSNLPQEIKEEHSQKARGYSPIGTGLQSLEPLLITLPSSLVEA